MEWLNLAIECVTKKYVTFEGRANRAEYWGFTLLVTLVSLVLGVILGVILGIFSVNSDHPDLWVIIGYVVSGLTSVAILCPSLAVGVRRMHDLGKGGGWIFISLIPLIGPVWYLVLTLLHGERQENRFGAVPATTIR